jgi:hypothetical protein
MEGRPPLSSKTWDELLRPPLSRAFLAELDDALTPHDLTPALAMEIVIALLEYGGDDDASRVIPENVDIDHELDVEEYAADVSDDLSRLDGVRWHAEQLERQVQELLDALGSSTRFAERIKRHPVIPAVRKLIEFFDECQRDPNYFAEYWLEESRVGRPVDRREERVVLRTMTALERHGIALTAGNSDVLACVLRKVVLPSADRFAGRKLRARKRLEDELNRWLVTYEELKEWRRARHEADRQWEDESREADRQWEEFLARNVTIDE